MLQTGDWWAKCGWLKSCEIGEPAARWMFNNISRIYTGIV
jgi:hypothetical protein